MHVEIPQNPKATSDESFENGKREVREEEAYQACLKKIKETLTDQEWETFKQGLEKYRTTLVIESLEK